MFQRKILLMAIPLLATAGCVPSVGGVISGLQTIKAVSDGMEVYDEFWEARKKEIPLAGTYRITYSFPDEEPVTAYIRTLKNANMPIMVDRNSTAPGALDYNGDDVSFDGYMVNVVGGTTLSGVPDSLDAAYKDGKPTPELGGFMIVTEPLGKDEHGHQQYVGTFIVAVADDASGEAARLRELLSKTETEFREYEEHQREESRQAARRDRYKFWKQEEQPEEESNLLARIKTVIPLASDGTVKGTQVYAVEGEEKMRITFERISLDAYQVPAENLDAPSLGELFRGYRDAASSGGGRQ